MVPTSSNLPLGTSRSCRICVTDHGRINLNTIRIPGAGDRSSLAGMILLYLTITLVSMGIHFNTARAGGWPSLGIAGESLLQTGLSYNDFLDPAVNTGLFGLINEA